MSLPGAQPGMLNSTTLAPSVIGETEEQNRWAAANLQEESKLDSALSQYNQIRGQYGEILSEAIRTQDPARRTQLISTITAMNQQLTTIVSSIREMYQSGQTTLTVYSTLKQDSVVPPYTLYIVGILMMLIILLVLFTFTSLMTNVESILPTMPELPSLGLSGPSQASVM